MAGSTFFPLPRDQVGGAIVVNVFAILSAIALLAFALRIVYLAVLNVMHRDIGESKEYVFFRTQIGYYAACLLLANMFNSISGLLGLRTLVEGGTFQDGYCSAQGFLMQFGNLSTAYFTTAIGLHTFNSLVLRNRQSIAVYSVAIIFGWVVAGILSSLPFVLSQPEGVVYGVSGLSCGLRPNYAKVQFLLHLLPIFFTATVSAILYALVFLVLRGTLVIRGGVKLQLNPGERWNVRLDGYHKFVGGIARSMLWYPIAYIALLIPYSVTRLFTLSGFPVPFQALVFAFTCWFMLGVVNVLLLYNTLRVLSPAFDGSSKDPESTAGRDPKQAQYSPDGMQERTLYPFPALYPMSPAATDVSGYDSERNLLSYPERVASIASYYSYPSSIANNIAAVSTLNRSLASPEAVSRTVASSPPPERVKQHSRESSNDSLISLPAPPRRTRTPPMAREPTADIVRTQPKKLVVVPPQTGPISPSSPQTAGSPFEKREASVRARTPSDGSKTATDDLDITGWLAKQNPDGSMPRGLKNRPLLSAVTPSFPNNSSASPISAKSSSGARSLFVVLDESDSSPRTGPSPITTGPSTSRYNFI